MPMPRIPEPELMEDAEQAAAYAAADFADVNAAFVTRFFTMYPQDGGHVVDLGCGPADIPIRMCRARPGLRVTGVDGAAAMLELGWGAAVATGVEDRLRLVQASLPDGLPEGPFDAVVSNSLLHHLPDPAVLWRAVKALGKPGAPVLVTDLTRPDSEADAQRIVDEYAKGEPEVLRRDFFMSLRAAFTVDEIREQLEAAALPHLEVEVSSDRHVTVFGAL